MTGRTKISTMTYKVTFKNQVFDISADVRDSGEDLILFIHGLGCCKESFDEAFSFSGLSNFRLLSPDLVGFGESSRPQDFSYSMEDQAEILRLIIDEIGFDKIHIVAHSMGGAIGLLLVENLGDSVASFTNIEGNLIAEDCGLISRKTLDIPFEDFRDTVFDKFRSKGPHLWKKWSAKSDALGFYRTCESLVEWSDSRKLLDIFEKLEAEKIYVYGDENVDMEIISQLRDIRKMAVPNSGHFVMNDNPEEFYTLLCEILKGQIVR